MYSQSVAEKFTTGISEVKYLGAILDQGMNWNKQVDKITHTESIAYWYRQRLFW